MPHAVPAIEVQTEAIEPSGVASMLPRLAREHGGRTAVSIAQGGRFREHTYAQLAAEAESVAALLIESGLRHGERVAIAADSGPEWVAALFGVWQAGGTAVPLDARLADEELSALLADAEPAAVFLSPRLAAAGQAWRKALPALRSMVALEDGALSSPRVPHAPRARGGAETALVVYTSGTTRRPKGVMISFDNLAFEVGALLEALPLRSDDVFLSMLPLHHLLELVGGLLCVLSVGAQVCYARTLLPSELVEVSARRGVTWMVTVPMVLALLQAEIERSAARRGRWASLLFGAAVGAARLAPPALRRRIFRRVHQRLGGRFRGFVCGGAPLPPSVERFFRRLDLRVCRGYGLTECSPVIAVDCGRAQPGSVGRPLRGVEVKIAGGTGESQGEVLTRGPHLMQGYFRRPDLTAEVIDARGFLHTGDLGRLDGEGRLYVTGRLKDLIVLPSGKKVNPEEVEPALLRSTLFKEACVVASPLQEGPAAGADEVCAVVVFEESAPRSPGEARAEVARLVAGLAPFKRPTRVIVYPNALPRSAIRKVRRRAVAEWVASGAAGGAQA